MREEVKKLREQREQELRRKEKEPKEAKREERTVRCIMWPLVDKSRLREGGHPQRGNSKCAPGQWGYRTIYGQEICREKWI